MEKRDTPLDRVSSRYGGHTLYVATKHGKERIVAPLFAPYDIRCDRIEVDTDSFGTFSGEVERTGSVRETLRKKLEAGADAAPHGRLFLASEGSFGPDPIFGFVRTDLESLLFWDRELNTEIYAEYLCRSPIHDEVTIGPDEPIRPFLEKIQFPAHAVIVRPADSFVEVVKGLVDLTDVEEAIRRCAALSPHGKALVVTDLRAHLNKTRRDAIAKAADLLVQKLKSGCPDCDLPGFWIVRGIAGLPCESCGEPSQIARAVLFGCVKCDYTEERPRPDGRVAVSAGECGYCNP